ncbi:hypothetical protein LSH36_786g00039 [Paralvinella palmiformis]|uniref:Uncharacterized protein n=1 Tax=Paralvinella palmiformis TaxID=53620 RepID=A0AAD9J028_9ANNE|nr:hypothetical protein LSH36_786g00039 [Paralvinella palmiformis]
MAKLSRLVWSFSSHINQCVHVRRGAPFSSHLSGNCSHVCLRQTIYINPSFIHKTCISSSAFCVTSSSLAGCGRLLRCVCQQDVDGARHSCTCRRFLISGLYYGQNFYVRESTASRRGLPHAGCCYPTTLSSTCIIAATIWATSLNEILVLNVFVCVCACIRKRVYICVCVCV